MPRVYPKKHKHKSDFWINKWKWYVVDLRNWHKPWLVRKHLDNKKQALQFRDKYFDKHFQIISGHKAISLGLKDKINLRKKNRHSQEKHSKYIFPPHVITPMQKISYRSSQRAKHKRKVAMDFDDLMIILEDQPILFQKRLWKYKANHFPFSQPVPELKIYQKYFTWHDDLKHLSNISRCMRDYYERDIGDFPIATIAQIVYDVWGDRVKRHGESYPNTPKNVDKVVEELYARGWKGMREVDFNDKEDSFIHTINLPVILVYPELCWHGIEDKDVYDHYIYDFHDHMGIPNFTGAYVPV